MDGIFRAPFRETQNNVRTSSGDPSQNSKSAKTITILADSHLATFGSTFSAGLGTVPAMFHALFPMFFALFSADRTDFLTKATQLLAIFTCQTHERRCRSTNHCAFHIKLNTPGQVPYLLFFQTCSRAMTAGNRTGVASRNTILKFFLCHK
jgi:hypothetical protein